MILLLAAMAHAACPCEGFRVTTVAAGRSVFTRVALVEDFDGAFYQELTLGGQTWAGRFGFATELAATSGFSEGWTGYGLGNSGWVTITPPPDALPSVPQMQEWIEESYRAQAPRRFVKELDDRS